MSRRPPPLTAVRWDRVDFLVDASPSLADIRAHGLQLFAAQRWRAAGRPLPGDLAHEVMQARWRTHTAPRALQAVRAACDGPIMLVKGPAVASLYPDPTLRPFVDIDLLVPDAHATQAQLLAAGFKVAGDPAHYPDDLHHLPPLYSPEHRIPIEVHSRLKWVDGLPAPSYAVLAAAARPGALGVDGIAVLAPAPHALVLAGHLWAHDPLTRLLRILDIAVMAAASDGDEIAALARGWRVERMWSSTVAAAESLFGRDRGPYTWPLRTWARGLTRGREPSVAELHLSRLLTPLAIHPPVPAARALAAAVRGFVVPHDDEPWGRKLARTAQQIARPGMRRSEHLEALKSDRRPRDD